MAGSEDARHAVVRWRGTLDGYGPGECQPAHWSFAGSSSRPVSRALMWAIDHRREARVTLSYWGEDADLPRASFEAVGIDLRGYDAFAAALMSRR